MDALVILLVGGIVAAVLWSWLARRDPPGDTARRRGGSDPSRLRSAEQLAEDRAALEAQDLAQLLEATNRRRRDRGLRERTCEDVERELSRAAARRRDRPDRWPAA